MNSLCEEDLAFLNGIFLFRDLERDALRALTEDEGCRMVAVEKGKTIFTPTEFERALGVLLAGEVQVSKAGFQVSVLAAGEVFGAAALFNGAAVYATTLTARRPCRAMLFTQKSVARAMAQHPAVASSYIAYLSGRIRFLEGKLDTLLAPSAQGKLAQYLRARRMGAGVTLDCSMRELAQRLDVGRTSLYRAFEELTMAGAIEKQGKIVFILKEELLV